MKALSIRQPWAWLIVNGYKDVENRTWRTPYRGPVLIHAGTVVERSSWEWVAYYHPKIPMPPLASMPRGGIVGQATITDCVQSHQSPWFEGPFGFVLADAKPLPLRRLVGRLGFFDAGVPGGLEP